MAHSTIFIDNLSKLVQITVPECRNNHKLRDELVSQCQDILASRIGQHRESDIAHLTELAQRHLSQHSHSSTSVLRFTNLMSKLIDQPILSRKNAAVQFLYSLASSSSRHDTAPPFLPTLDPPHMSKAARQPEQVPAAEHGQTKKKPVKSKAEILRRYRENLGKPHLSEALLLRDALYILQGISGKYVKLVEDDVTSAELKVVFEDDPRYIISNPNRTLIHRIAELGHLYTRVAKFVKVRERKAGVGMIEQSLCHYLESQLTEYYRLIAVLESQMHLSQSGDGSEESNAVEEESGLTLKRLEVWVDDWRLRLRMMSACVEGCHNIYGGALVNLIHTYTRHGDPFVRKVTDELLEEVSKPFFAMLHKWLFSGELYDPFSEFFVYLDPELAHVQYIQPSGIQPSGAVDGGVSGVSNGDITIEHQSGLRLWETKYVFRKEMLPAFVGETFGRKIFSTGKSLNFIRFSCHDSDWVATREKLGNASGTLQYSDIGGLEQSIDTAYSVASQRLFDVFFEKFGLLLHLRALKNYMFLGHGDFAEALMDSLAANLSKPANALFRHNLTAKLEEAIRSTNAQNDPPDVLRRLDARMLEYSHGEIGWDVFTLEYKADAPIDTVLDSDTMIKYLRVFAHLWKLKRVESELTASWMRVAGGSRTFLRNPELDIEWHQVRLSMSEMIHFVRQVQAFCHLEVIACQWKKLMEFIHKKEGGLDALIEAHRTYVEAIDEKILLRYPKPGKENIILNQMKELLEIILRFKTVMDDFYNYTLAESARRDSLRDKQRGIYTDPRLAQDQAAAREALPRILQRTRDYSTTFTERVQALVSNLSVHPDLDCKYLGIRLSFSDFYKTRKEREKVTSPSLS